MITQPDLSLAEWVKSSYSGNGGGNCVEWAPDHTNTGPVRVRDSKSPHSRPLAFESSAWAAFVTVIRGDDLAV
ncbi:DUF397 domain-containing protein [Streptomyces sp. ST2-7A]|uniref:DUF397 domain-containing protein n=1 Tax=Streptomyces sp. ST2-7A TaxID=2907214 RepID=UPI001F31631A|nr:DUF397 domain-containing protein [Streptomyces sp. ST2-7A]MCE7080426.1 DUF397 domain-containing protein [Streptomyces sp. ST2-7A]